MFRRIVGEDFASYTAEIRRVSDKRLQMYQQLPQYEGIYTLEEAQLAVQEIAEIASRYNCFLKV